MKQYEYIKFEDINIQELTALLNKSKVRQHLIHHNTFNTPSTKSWVREKIKINELNGCKVRGICINNSLVGWCGIQPDNGNYEIAIVLDDKTWGLGKTIFKDIMKWAKNFGHKELLIHLLDSRPQYDFLIKLSKDVFTSEINGRKFTTYQITVY